MNLFDIIGPVMVGPSSSHTAGAVRIAATARALLGAEPRQARIVLYGSLATTGEGHGTRLALLGGLLGLAVDDPAIAACEVLAQRRGLQVRFERSADEPRHPNTAMLELTSDSGTLSATGVSLGGGRVQITQIDGIDVQIGSDTAALVLFHTDTTGVLANLTRVFAARGVNIASMSDFRQSRGGRAIAVFEVDTVVDVPLQQALRELPTVHHVVYLPGGVADDSPGGPDYTLAKLCEQAQRQGCAISDVVIAGECARNGVTEEQMTAELRRYLSAMRESVEEGLQITERSHSGLSGGDAQAMSRHGGNLLGPVFHTLVARALAAPERNARMGRVVACPTAGSCGILPAVLLTMADITGCGDEALLRALATAGGVGLAIARRATLAGAAGGCQAECGSAAAMAAAAAVELAGGGPEAAIHGAALAMKGQMGLTCDPVGGLVEVPCVKRNGFSATAAFTAAEMALSGVRSVVPPDEVIEAMRDTGRRMPRELRETAQGGLALSSVGRRVDEWLKNQE
jgi:L-serine dehydratase